MAQRILITQYNYDLTEMELENIFASVAQAFADVPGCKWKIWLLDAGKKEAGAIYLFENLEALENFKASPLVASVLSHPALSNFQFRETDIIIEPGAITRAPVN
ncbi:MAG: YdhR family protein [Sphingobacteriales bacterium]